MAGQTHTVDIGDDLLPPWKTVFEVAHALDVSDWILVGGLMVQLHARRAALPVPRATKDVDLIVDLLTNRTSLSSTAGSLSALGFEAIVPDSQRAPVYRYARGDEQVDVMIADHLPTGIRPRLRLRPALAAEGGAQALNRRDTFIVSSTSGSITIGAPDVLGALVGKGAAFLVDPRDRGRHLDDAAVLLASIDSVGELSLDLGPSDRKRLRVIAAELSNVTCQSWSALSPPQRARGQRNLELLVKAGRLGPH